MNQSWLLLALFLAGMGVLCRTDARADESAAQSAYKLKLALDDLIETHGSAFPEGPQYLKRLDALLPALKPGSHQTREKLETLLREALLASPALLELPGILVVQRKPKDPRSPAVMTAEDERIGDSAGLARDIAMAIVSQDEYHQAFFYHGSQGSLAAIRWEKWKLHLDPNLELFDLEQDPGETKPLRNSQVIRKLRGMAILFQEEMRTGTRPAGEILQQR
jgi:hypothetical protein